MCFFDESMLANQLYVIHEESQRLENNINHSKNNIIKDIQEIKSKYSLYKDKNKSLRNKISNIEGCIDNTQKLYPILNIEVPSENDYTRNLLYSFSYFQIKINRFTLTNVFMAKMPGYISYFNDLSNEKMFIVGGDGFFLIYKYSQEDIPNFFTYSYGWVVTVPGFRNCVLDVSLIKQPYHLVFFCTEDGYIRVYDTKKLCITGEILVDKEKPCECIHVMENEILAYSNAKIKFYTYSASDYGINFSLKRVIDIFVKNVESIFISKFNNQNFGVYTNDAGKNTFIFENNSFECINEHNNLKNESDLYIINTIDDEHIEFCEKSYSRKQQGNMNNKIELSNVTYKKCFNKSFGIGCNDMFYLWRVNVNAST